MKIIGLGVGLIVSLVGLFLLYIQLTGIPSYPVPKIEYVAEVTPKRLERGKKLASMLCAGCHMNTSTGKLTGKHMGDAPNDFGMIYAPNITQDNEHGIGGWTDAQIMYLLRTGIKPNGDYAPPWMAKLPLMSDEDLASIIVFIKSDDKMVAADPTPDKPCEPSFLSKFLSHVAFKPLPMPERPIAEPPTVRGVELGAYLAKNLDCYSCHSKDFATNDFLVPEYSEGYFGGGNPVLNLEGEVVMTANLTPHETGIKNWTDAQFIKALRFGLKDGEDALRYPMAPYPQLTDEEGSLNLRLFTNH